MHKIELKIIIQNYLHALNFENMENVILQQAIMVSSNWKQKKTL